ncbi:MAG: hypothetical protein ACLFUJ_03625 [Phycisphaerae bacterium]
MTGSRTIQVLKRQGCMEDFSLPKLARSLWLAMAQTDPANRYEDAVDLAEAISIFLQRTNRICVSAGVLFEMCLKVLRRSALEEAADEMETYHVWRQVRRKQIRVVYDDDKAACWDKSWLAELACRSWNVTPATSRILAGMVEDELLDSETSIISRLAVVDLLNEFVSQYGLADAVPVRQHSAEI